MPDTELLNATERKAKIKKFIIDLSARFSGLVWGSVAKTERLHRLKPNVSEEFWKRWDELDKRCADYIQGKIEWEGDAKQMEFTDSNVPYPHLEVDRDVENYGRDLYVWLVLQVKDL